MIGRALLSLSLLLPALAGAQDQGGAVLALEPGAALSLDGIERLKEDALLGPGRRPTLHAVADAAGRVHPEREPLLLVHGIRADFGDLAPLLRRLGERQTRFQPWVLAYSDYHRRTSKNGDDLAALLVERFQGRPVSIVAHSMGGIVTRRALNRLALEGRLGAFPRLRVVAVDVPWHGYAGPGDGLRMGIARLFMPDGLEDMRARAPLFAGKPGAADPLDRAGLYGVELPASVTILQVVARQGDQALDWRELPGVVEQLARRLAGEPFDDGLDPRVRHAVSAILQSAVGARLLREGPRPAGELGPLLEGRLLRLEGDHATVLAGERFLGLLGWFLGVDLARSAPAYSTSQE